MTDFSHLHALEERAVRIRERMIDVQKNDAQWKAQAVQLFQTEKEIADEREFLGLEDMSTDDLYAGLIEKHESEVVREVTAIANSVEQAEQIRTAAEALVLKLKDFEYEEWAGNPEISFADFVEVELTALKEALSRGWLSRGKADKPLWEKHAEQERQALVAALAERERLDPNAPKTVIVGGEIETFEITQEEIDAVPSGDPGQWEISMRELCQEIEKLPASEQQTAISVKASAIYQSLGEFNRYCESFFDAAVSEKLCNFMNTHAFQPGDSEHGWEKQCSVIAPDGLRHCGGYREDHPMSVKAEGK